MIEFIKELHEARMTKGNGNVRVLTYTDCCERLYLTVLTLELLRMYAQFRMNARQYARRSVSFDTFTQYRLNGTDLQNLAYFVNGSDEALNKLKDPGSAKRLAAKTSLPTNQLTGFLRNIANGTQPTRVNEFFLRLESSLNITNTDYKAIRRNILLYPSLSTRDKQNTVTRLLFAARAKLRNSDIIDDLSKLAVLNDLETGRVIDNEPTVSVPDISTDARDLSLYRYLVGADNLMKTKNFLNLAKDGKSVPSQFVQGYLPAVKMLDDIVKAGPAYINLLRSLHQRAKKSRK